MCKLLFFITAITGVQDILAQERRLDVDLADTVYVADNRIQVHDLQPYTSVYVDSSNTMTIQEVSSEIIRDRFQSFAGPVLPTQPYITYWLKVSIFASGNIQDWWLLFSGAPGYDTVFSEHSYVDVYFLDSLNQLGSHQRTGQSVPRSEKTVKQNPGINRVLFSVNAYETKHVYIRIYDEYASAFIHAPQLRDPVVSIPDQDGEILLSVLAGAVFLIAIVSFFFFFFVRERAYLFFGMYALVLSLTYLVLHPDHPFLDIFIPEYPQLLEPVFILLTQSGFVFFILFGRYFINLPRLSKKLDTLLKWFLAIWVVNIIIAVMATMVTHKSYPVEIGYVFILLFFVFLVRIAFFKSILARFYVAGAIWLVGFTILGLIWNRYVLSLPFNPWPVGQLGQLIIYIAGLAYKVRLNEQARVQAEVVKLRNVELASLYDESTKQKGEIEQQKKNLEDTLADLKATQVQLIQSEKMASLGELTAGIAHEIQNPLNFVNNFAEVNAELIDELRSELATGNMQSANEIGGTIKENEEKIIFHGKRADAIVKGMLQHSRASSGVKEPTDINALVDEYLRLAYHGLRAKDKSFNSTIQTDFDESIGLINIVPQDIGRVVLNLITNAFYAAGNSSSLSPETSPPLPPNDSTTLTNRGGKENAPTVIIKTRKLLPPSGGKGVHDVGEPTSSGVEIRITDNGPGIPSHILDKIFQPFFTTKPAGQGTGLGLSLSYDLVKAHGGELKVETKEGEGSEFIIQLPII